MFQFTTTTVINSLNDLSTGKDLFEGSDANVVRVKRVANFKKENITALYKAEGHSGEPAKVTIDLKNVAAKKGDFLRLSLYVGLTEASQDSRYSNDFYSKGKPFSVEFEYLDSNVATPTETLAKLKNTIDKYQIFVFGDKLLNVSVTGTFITIDAVNEFQRFKKVSLELFEAPSEKNPSGSFIVKKSLEKGVGTQIKNQDSKATLNGSTEGIFVGKEGFGTYSFLLHNLRIPTFENTRPFGVAQAEAPIVGATYDQYTIHYCVNRGILGSNAVGDEVKSMTTHVFFVLHSLAATFEGKFTSMGIKLIPVNGKKPVTENPTTLESRVAALEKAAAQVKG